MNRTLRIKWTPSRVRPYQARYSVLKARATDTLAVIGKIEKNQQLQIIALRNDPENKSIEAEVSRLEKLVWTMASEHMAQEKEVAIFVQKLPFPIAKL